MSDTRVQETIKSTHAKLCNPLTDWSSEHPCRDLLVLLRRLLALSKEQVIPYREMQVIIGEFCEATIRRAMTTFQTPFIYVLYDETRKQIPKERSYGDYIITTLALLYHVSLLRANKTHHFIPKSIRAKDDPKAITLCRDTAMEDILQIYQDQVQKPEDVVKQIHIWFNVLGMIAYCHGPDKNYFHKPVTQPLTALCGQITIVAGYVAAFDHEPFVITEEWKRAALILVQECLRRYTVKDAKYIMEDTMFKLPAEYYSKPFQSLVDHQTERGEHRDSPFPMPASEVLERRQLAFFTSTIDRTYAWTSELVLDHPTDLFFSDFIESGHVKESDRDMLTLHFFNYIARVSSAQTHPLFHGFVNQYYISVNSELKVSELLKLASGFYLKCSPVLTIFCPASDQKREAFYLHMSPKNWPPPSAYIIVHWLLQQFKKKTLPETLVEIFRPIYNHFRESQML